MEVLEERYIQRYFRDDDSPEYEVRWEQNEDSEQDSLPFIVKKFSDNVKSTTKN